MLNAINVLNAINIALNALGPLMKNVNHAILIIISLINKIHVLQNALKVIMK